MRKRLWMCIVMAAAGCGSGGGGMNGGDDAGGDSDGAIPAIDGSTPPADAAPPDAAPTRSPPLAGLHAGQGVTCATLTDGTGRCWGDNRIGQLGDGTRTSSVRPVTVMGLNNIASISPGYDHTCALLKDGTARCWGEGSVGQLGDGMNADSNSPVVVSSLSGLIDVQAGVYTSCALTGTGDLYCWGRGGDLGDGGFAASPVPKKLPTLAKVKQFSLSSIAGGQSPIHACGVRMDGTAFCWGGNDVGQLGDGTQSPARAPVEVMGVTDALEIRSGANHTCARRTSGLSCWGFGALIGDGMQMQRLVPTAVMTTETVTALQVGWEVTLARTSAGGLICWGRDGRGTCGDGATFTPGGPVHLAPVRSLPTDVVMYSVGGNHGCAQNGAGYTTCWGTNEYGEAGSGTPSSLYRSSTPTYVNW